MIKFLVVRMKNFLGVGNYWQEIDLTKAKNTLVTGPNGSGKSAIILDSITYALFGRANREIKNEQLINWITNKECLVELEFMIGADHYKIVRGQKPAIFEIYKNAKNFRDIGIASGIVKEEADKRDYQRTLEESILRMNLKTFKQVVIIGSATYEPLMQLKVPDRRGVVEDLLDITIYSAMNKKATAKAKTLVLEIKSLDTEIGFRKEQERTQREMIKSMDAERKRREEEADAHIAEAKKDIEDEKEQIAAIDTQLETLDEQFAEKAAALETQFDKQIEDATAEISAIEIPTASSVYKDKIRVLQDSRSKLSKQLGKHESVIETEEEQIEFYQQADCPTCGQEITSDHRHMMNEKSNTTITEAKAKLAEANSLIEQFNEKVKKQQAEMDLIAEKESLVAEKKRELSSLTAQKKREVDALAAEKKREIESLKRERRQCESNIERTQATIEQWSGSVDSSALKKAKKEYKENVAKLAELADQKAEKQDELSYQEVAKLMLKDDGIKAQQIADDLPEINRLINEYLKKFDLFISFELTPTFDEVIKARFREKATYNSFSEGQKRRIDHSILFAFREIAMAKGSISCNLVAFDEILEKNLDDDGKDVLKELITLIDPDVHVFVISPIAFTEEFFDRKLTITYPNEFTKITEEMK